MNFDHVLKFAGVLALIALLSCFDPLGRIGCAAILIAGLWTLTA